jgi:hypothetical protein
MRVFKSWLTRWVEIVLIIAENEKFMQILIRKHEEKRLYVRILIKHLPKKYDMKVCTEKDRYMRMGCFQYGNGQADFINIP